MKIKWSGIGIVDGRGKINGSVASKNRSGAYMRTKVTPVNRRTTAQQAVRTSFGFIAQQWRGLTEIQRKAWGGAVENFKSTDIFGDLKSPSGFNLFSKLNLPLINTTGGWNVTPPSPIEVNSYSIDSLLFGYEDTGGGAFPVLTIDLKPFQGNTGGGILVIDVTPNLSAGINNPTTNYRRFHHEVIADMSTATTLLLGLDYRDAYGIELGSKVFVRVSVIAASGQVSVPVTAAAIAVNII